MFGLLFIEGVPRPVQAGGAPPDLSSGLFPVLAADSAWDVVDRWRGALPPHFPGLCCFALRSRLHSVAVVALAASCLFLLYAVRPLLAVFD